MLSTKTHMGIVHGSIGPHAHELQRTNRALAVRNKELLKQVSTHVKNRIGSLDYIWV